MAAEESIQELDSESSSPSKPRITSLMFSNIQRLLSFAIVIISVIVYANMSKDSIVSKEVATALAVTGVGASVGLAAYFYYRSEVERQRREAATSGPAAPLNDVQDASVAIVKELSTSTSSPGSSNVAAAPTGYLTCELIRREMCSNDVGVFEFQLPGDLSLTLPVGRHVIVKAVVNERSTSRPYTPIDPPEVPLRTISLLIRKYDLGKMSKHIHSLAIGDTLEIRGPIGRYRHEEKKREVMFFICAGTGVTPIYQVARYMAENEVDLRHKCIVLSQHRQPEDILLEKELKQLAEKPGVIVECATHLSRGDMGSGERDGEKGNRKQGYINKNVIHDVLDRHCRGQEQDRAQGKVLFLLCGPSGFNQSVVNAVTDLGFSKEDTYTF